MHKKTIEGFTLIELIIVVSILVGLSGALVLSGTEARNLGKVNRAAIQLESALKEAQAMGNAGKAFPPDEAHLEESFDKGYGVNVNENSDTIYIYGGQGDGSSNGDDNFDSGNIYETIIFEGGVEIPNNGIVFSPTNPNTGKVDILFRRGEGKANIRTNSGAAPKNSVTITLKKGSAEKRVVVNKQGLIYSE